MKRLSFLKSLTDYIAVGLLITPKIIAIIAITNNTCIIPVAEYKNTPNAQPISRITATIYNNEFMINVI
jgi:hypothetical protein